MSRNWTCLVVIEEIEQIAKEGATKGHNTCIEGHEIYETLQILIDNMPRVKGWTGQLLWIDRVYLWVDELLIRIELDVQEGNNIAVNRFAVFDTEADENAQKTEKSKIVT